MRIAIALVFGLFLGVFNTFGQNIRWIQPGMAPRSAAVAGNYLVTGAGEFAYVWDRSGGQLRFVKSLHGDGYYLWPLAASADGTTVTAVTDNQAWIAWNLETGRKFNHYLGRFSMPFYQSRSNRLVTLTYGWMRFFDVATETQVGEIDFRNQGFPSGFTPDDTALYYNESGRVRLLTLATGQEREFRPRATAAIHTIAFSADSSLLAMDIHESASDPDLNSILIYNAATGRIEKTLRRGDGGKGMLISADNTLLAAITSADDVVVWDLTTSSVRRTFAGPFAGPFVFVDNNRLLVGGKIFNLTTGQITPFTSEGTAWHMEFNPAGTLIATESHVCDAANGEVRAKLYRTATAQKLALEPIRRFVVPITFAERDSRLYVGQDLFDLPTGSQIGTLPGRYPSSFGNEFYVTSGWDQETEIAELRRYSDGSIIRRLVMPPSYHAWATTVSPSQNLIATARTFNPNDPRVRIWNANTGVMLSASSSDVLIPYKLKFSNDERLIAAASDQSGEVAVWDVASGRELLRTQTVWNQRAVAFEFLHGSTFFVTGGKDGLDVWDLSTRQRVSRLENEITSICSIEASPDGSKLAIGRLDGAIVLIDAPAVDRMDIQAAGPGTTLRFFARPGVNYTVESSGNLRDWSTFLQTIGAGQTVSRELPSGETRYFRMR